MMAAAIPPPPNHAGFKLSATGRSVLRRRTDPGKLPSALFALVLHVGFFALIVFGVSWQVKVQAPLHAEIWRDLPTVDLPTPAPAPPPPTEAPPPAIKPEPVVPSKADIALKVKKERDEKIKIEQQKREEQKRIEDKKKADEDRKLKAETEKARAEAEARVAALQSARQRAVENYGARIGALIRNRANIPDSVRGQPIVEVRLRLLTNGAVLEAQIQRPSGNRTFDEAVERAINGIRQWPQPDDPTILGGRRELILRIEHER